MDHQHGSGDEFDSRSHEHQQHVHRPSPSALTRSVTNSFDDSLNHLVERRDDEQNDSRSHTLLAGVRLSAFA